jgi:hypothetical protein
VTEAGLVVDAAPVHAGQLTCAGGSVKRQWMKLAARTSNAALAAASPGCADQNAEIIPLRARRCVRAREENLRASE